jgi:hypothetical protein
VEETRLPGQIMQNVIPIELRNSQGLRKLKEFYAEQLEKLHGDESAPSLEKLRSDIQCIESELVGKSPVVSATARK